MAIPDQQAAVLHFDPDYYREQAARFRQLAAVLSEDRLTGEMLQLAAAYEMKAAQLEAQTMRRVAKWGAADPDRGRE